MSSNNHEQGLIKRMHSLLESGRYSDLTIICRGREFCVHRNVLCPASKFFAAACDGEFKEAQTARLDLSDDDPDTLERMLVYLYTADYNDENVLNTKETPVNGAQNGETSGTVAESSNKDNTDDAPAQASSLFTKPVAPAGAQDVQNYSMHRERASVSACLNNVLLYSLGEKYDDMKSLKELAKCKLEIRSSGNWREDDILHVLQEIYSTTPAADRGLRDIIINVCARYADDLMLHEGFRQLLQQDAALAMEILDRVHSTKLQLGQRAHDLEQHKTRLQTQEATLKDELEWTKEEKRLLHENLAQHGKCRHCSKGLDLSVVRGSRVGFVSTKSREVQMRCSRCSTKYSSF